MTTGERDTTFLAGGGEMGALMRAHDWQATSLGDPVSPHPLWLPQAHRQLGDLLRETDRAGARRHFARFLDLAPNAAGSAEVRQALTELGGR